MDSSPILFDVLQHVYTHAEHASVLSASMVSKFFYETTDCDNYWKRTVQSTWSERVIRSVKSSQNNSLLSWRELCVLLTRKLSRLSSALRNKVLESPTNAKRSTRPIEFFCANDDVRTQCRASSQETLNVSKRLQQALPNMQFKTQRVDTMFLLSSDGVTTYKEGIWAPAIIWMRQKDSLEGYWSIRMSLDLSGWVFKYFELLDVDPSATDAEKMRRQIRRETSPFATDFLVSVDYADETPERRDLAAFLSWCIEVDSLSTKN